MAAFGQGRYTAGFTFGKDPSVYLVKKEKSDRKPDDSFGGTKVRGLLAGKWRKVGPHDLIWNPDFPDRDTSAREGQTLLRSHRETVAQGLGCWNQRWGSSHGPEAALSLQEDSCWRGFKGRLRSPGHPHVSLQD